MAFWCVLLLAVVVLCEGAIVVVGPDRRRGAASLPLARLILIRDRQARLAVLGVLSALGAFACALAADGGVALAVLAVIMAVVVVVQLSLLQSDRARLASAARAQD